MNIRNQTARRCERSEAIQQDLSLSNASGLLRYARNDGL